MASNRLQLNAAKTEVLRMLQTVSNTSSQVIHFLSTEILSSPQSLFANWALFLDSDMSMKTRVSGTVSSCFAALRQIGLRSIRRSVSQSASFTVSRHLVGAVALRLRQCKPEMEPGQRH